MVPFFTVVSVALTFALIGAQRARTNGDRYDIRFACGAVALAGAAAAYGWVAPRPLPGSLLVAVPLATVSAATDASSGYIYDAILIPAAAALLAMACFDGGLSSALLGGVLLGALALVVRWVTRNRGLGLGDVKLFAVLGGAFGTHPALVLFGASFVLGALVAIPLMLCRRTSRGATLPFAPMIACAVLAMSWVAVS